MIFKKINADSTHLSTNHNCPGDHTDVRVLLDAVVQGDDMESVQQLPLVLMNTFHLTVKHGVHVDLKATGLFKVLRKSYFVFLR